MTNRLSLVALSLPFALSLSAHGAMLTEARSMGMGGVGVANANYLTASFHNPALVAHNVSNDSVGFILPSLSVYLKDENELYDKIDEFQDINDELLRDPSNGSAQTNWKNALLDLVDSRLDAEASLAMAFAIPNRYLSVNLFAGGQVSSMAVADVVEEDILGLNFLNPQSSAQAIAGATAEIGLSMAREFELSKGTFYLGVTPKYQQLYALSYTRNVNNFDDDDFDIAEDYTEASAFNMDLGAAYQFDEHWQFGVRMRNAFSQELRSFANGGSPVTYQVEPEIAAGLAYMHRWFNVAVDLDLNKTQPFAEFEHEVQFFSLGGELTPNDWVQLRLGYMSSLTDYADDQLTAGLGLKLFGTLGLDLAGRMGSDDSYGGAVQLVFQY